MRNRLIVMFGLLSGLSAAGAQDPLAPGTKVLIQKGNMSLRGILVSADANLLLVRSLSTTDTVHVPFNEVHRLYRASGTHGHAVTGLAMGTAIGLVLGGVVMMSGPDGSYEALGQAVGNGAGVLALCIVMGTAIGAGSRSTRWSRVSDDRWRVSVSPAIRLESVGSDPQIGLTLRIGRSPRYSAFSTNR